MEKYIKYIENFQCGNLEEVKTWINSNLTNFLNKNNEEQDEIEHILDYLCSDKAPKKLRKMSYEQALNNSIKWQKQLNKLGSKLVDKDGDLEDVLVLDNGFSWVKLLTPDALKREGSLMKHCVGGGGYDGEEIYSLRDKNNNPHCTIQKDNQIKGKGNGNISPKYIKYVIPFLEFLGMSVSDNEMRNLGYFNASKYEKELRSDCLKNSYNSYLPISSKLLNKDGSRFFDLDLIVDLGLIDDAGKINIDLNLIDIGVKKLLKNASSGNYSKNASSGRYSQNASSGNNSQNASSGNYSKNASSGDNSKNASSGDNSQNASSGNYSKNASSGDNSKNASSGDNSQNASSGRYSQNASSGNYSQNASSGNYSKNASSGDNSKNASSGRYSQNASSGDNSQNASSGNYSKNASSGNYSKNASSGNYSKNASSGNYSKNASSGDNSTWVITGQNSIVASIGHKDKVKATKGTWVTLAEYKKIDNILTVSNVVSKLIDGVILKENVFYTLVGGEFTEVKN